MQDDLKVTAFLQDFGKAMRDLDDLAISRRPASDAPLTGNSKGSKPLSYVARAEVVDWIDGDTVDVEVSLWFDLTLSLRVRLHGVDTPELHSGDPESREKAKMARVFCETRAPAGALVHIASVGDKDKFGRFLAKVTLTDGTDLVAQLIEHGHGKPYFGGRKG